MVKSLVYFELIFVYSQKTSHMVQNWVKGPIDFFFLMCQYPIFPTLVIEQTIHFPLHRLGIFVKDWLTMYDKFLNKVTLSIKFNDFLCKYFVHLLLG